MFETQLCDQSTKTYINIDISSNSSLHREELIYYCWFKNHLLRKIENNLWNQSLSHSVKLIWWRWWTRWWKKQIFYQIRREEISTQRNSSQFEMTENVVSSRKQSSIRDLVVTRRREWKRKRDRERDRDREREDRNDINVSTKNVNEVIE
jgi:hypothetical protein